MPFSNDSGTVALPLAVTHMWQWFQSFVEIQNAAGATVQSDVVGESRCSAPVPAALHFEKFLKLYVFTLLAMCCSAAA